MKECCIESFAMKGIREHFRLAREDEGHTCETCGTVFRYREATKWQAVEGASTINEFLADNDRIDLGWARGTRDRAKGVIYIQCWGCGGMIEIPDAPFTEYHFNHAGPCSLTQALANHKRGVMPRMH